MNRGRTKSYVFFFLVCAVLVSGCVGVSNANFSLSASSVPRIQNTCDRYCLIQIREDRLYRQNVGQTPPPVEEVQRRLEIKFPEWFSSGPDAVPVIALSKTSAPYYPGWYDVVTIISIPVHICTLGLVPMINDASQIDFTTYLETGKGAKTGGADYFGTTFIVLGNPQTLKGFFPESSGWESISPEDGSPRFDQNKERKLDAFCASVALAVQRLTPEERQALRENNEAWWLDAKMGNRRNRPVSVVKAAPAPEMPTPMAANEGKPRIISQSWDSRTRRGEIMLDLSNVDREAAVAWIRDEYLPEYCMTLGVAVSADNPASTPSANVRIDEIEDIHGETCKIVFSIMQ